MTLDYEPLGTLLLAHAEGCTLLCDDGGTGPSATVVDVSRLWDALGSPEPVRGILDELTRGGLAATPSFALVNWSGNPFDRATVVVRGAVGVTVTAGSSDTRLDGSDVATWREVSFQRVSAISVGTASSPSATSLPLGAGIVRAASARLRVSAGQASEPVVVSEPVDAASTAPPTAPSPLLETTITELGEAAADEYAHLFGETIVRSVEDAAVRPPDETDAALDPADADADVDAHANAAEDEHDLPQTDELGDHDGMTIVSGDLARLRDRARLPVPAPTAIAPAKAFFLELSNGGREPLTQPVIIGRSPSATKVSSGQVPRLVAITGDQDLSRNHALFSLQGGTVVVTDLHSRNGTSVVMPGKPPQRLREGEPMPVLVDSVVDLGGGITVTVRES